MLEQDVPVEIDLPAFLIDRLDIDAKNLSDAPTRTLTDLRSEIVSKALAEYFAEFDSEGETG